MRSRKKLPEGVQYSVSKGWLLSGGVCWRGHSEARVVWLGGLASDDCGHSTVDDGEAWEVRSRPTVDVEQPTDRGVDGD